MQTRDVATAEEEPAACSVRYDQPVLGKTATVNLFHLSETRMLLSKAEEVCVLMVPYIGDSTNLEYWAEWGLIGHCVEYPNLRLRVEPSHCSTWRMQLPPPPPQKPRASQVLLHQ